MKLKTKISFLVLTLVLLAPLTSFSVTAMQKSWGINEGDDFYYTFGIDGNIALPASLWDYLSEQTAMGLNDAFNDSYQIGWTTGYEEGYEFGWSNVTADPWNPSNPYEGNWTENSYEDGLEDGWWSGYWDGWYELDDGNAKYEEYYNNYWYDDYYGKEPFAGFPQSELDAFDLEHIFNEFLAMPKIFNMKIHIDHMYEDTFVNDWEFPQQEYYYDVINITVEMKLAGTPLYMSFEDFVVYYLNTVVRGFISSAFTGSIRDNITAGLDDGLAEIQSEIASPDYEPALINRGIVWGTGTNITIQTEEFAQQMAIEIMTAFGFNFRQEKTYASGWSEGYEEGYIEGWANSSAENPYEPWSEYDSQYQNGLRDGWNSGYNDGYYDLYYGYGMYGPNYHNEYKDNPEYDTYLTDFPEGYGYSGLLFIPQDLDVGAELEKAKDLANIALGRSHMIFLGGFNGLVEQLGLTLITNEKQVYAAGDINDAKYMFGKIFDLGGMLFLDQLNDEFDSLGLGFSVANDSLDLSALFNLKWDSNGILDNYHLELHIGMSADVLNLMGGNIIFDMSRGEQTTLNANFDPNVLPTQKYYPPSVFGNWGVNEGDIYDFTTSFDMNIEMPQYFWDEVNDGLWEMMNESYYYDTNMSLPVDETVDAENIFHTFMTEVPNVVNLQSKITDMLGIDEVQEQWEEQWMGDHNEWVYIGDVEHKYDFIAQYFLAKTPDENVYEPLGRLFNNIYEGFYDAVGASFPATYANWVQDHMDTMLDEMLAEKIPDTNVSVFDVVSYFVPTMLNIWGISSNDTNVPEWAKLLGIVDDFYFDLLDHGVATPSLFYVPTDFSFQNVYDSFMTWAESMSGGDFTEDLFIEFLTNMSVDDIYVNGKEIYLRWDIDNGINDIFFQTTGLDEVLRSWITQVYNDTGVQFLDTTVFGKLLFCWRYDDNGVLENFHLQMGVGIKTVTEELSYSVEFDISQGEFDGKDGQFLGEPLIHTYQHWMYPDLTHTLIVPPGAGNIIHIDSDTYDVHITLEVSAINGGTRISTQIWGDDPSTSDLFMSGTGVFFAIDVADPSNIELPLTITVDLRPELLALNESVLQELFTVYSYDEVADDWVEENFPVTFDMVAGTVQIEVSHLSAFAFGAKVSNGTTDDTATDDTATDDTATDDTATDDTNPFENIPGYSTGIFLIAAVATMAFVLKKRRH
ncbi:MAG: hypothetical protein K9W44_07615 [Candidatus Lokiarchaeota archaeon]|nr:hypothetical protein [Candidatus Harpocratesius repetitus]